MRGGGGGGRGRRFGFGHTAAGRRKTREGCFSIRCQHLPNFGSLNLNSAVTLVCIYYHFDITDHNGRKDSLILRNCV